MSKEVPMHSVTDPNVASMGLSTWFEELDTAVIDADRCIQCGTCVAACPTDSIGVGDDDLPELVKMCIGCGACWDYCPRGGLRYERQWKVVGGEDNLKGVGDPITEFTARTRENWHEKTQDGGVVTAILIRLLEAGEIDGAVIATESDEETWKAEPFIATTVEELVENAGTFYNQTMALGAVADDDLAATFPDRDPRELSLALVGTPCEVEGIRALQGAGGATGSNEYYGSHAAGAAAIDLTIALFCTKSFNYYRLIGDELTDKRDIAPDEIGKLDVIDGLLKVYDTDTELILEEDIAEFHGAALKGCDECADFSGYTADLTVGSVGSPDGYSSIIVRTEEGLSAWEATADVLEYRDLDDRSAIGGLQSWGKKEAFAALERPFDPNAPIRIDYTDHEAIYDRENL